MNSSGWNRFRKQQAAEREQLHRLLAGIQGLLVKCNSTTPTEIELSALAATIHSFYTGVENIFKRAAVELDHEPMRGESWHRELLLRMKMSNAVRSALISEQLYENLNEYLRFRHVFRNAYSFDLDWRKMSPLALRLEKTLQELGNELDDFLNSGSGNK